MDIALVKDKDKTQDSETTEDTKEGKNQVQNNHNHNIIFKDNMQNHNIGLILILTGLKKYSDKGAQFFKIIYLKRIQGQTDKYWLIFHVPFG